MTISAASWFLSIIANFACNNDAIPTDWRANWFCSNLVWIAFESTLNCAISASNNVTIIALFSGWSLFVSTMRNTNWFLSICTFTGITFISINQTINTSSFPSIITLLITCFYTISTAAETHRGRPNRTNAAVSYFRNTFVSAIFICDTRYKCFIAFFSVGSDSISASNRTNLWFTINRYAGVPWCNLAIDAASHIPIVTLLYTCFNFVSTNRYTRRLAIGISTTFPSTLNLTGNACLCIFFRITLLPLKFLKDPIIITYTFCLPYHGERKKN